MSHAINNFSGAAAAYARAKTGPSAAFGGQATGSSGSANESGFAALLQRALSSAVATGEKSEQLSLAALGDQADLTQVVTAVAEAETVLNTVVAVRDRVVEAYKDIMRMPI